MGTPGRKVAIGGIALTLALASGVVFAGGLVTGVGRGVAKAARSRQIVILDATGATNDELYPGATGDATITVENPNPFPVEITHVAANGSVTSDDSDCSDADGDPAKATGVSLSEQGLSFDNDVPARGSVDITIPAAVTMTEQSVSACQGAVFEIPVTLIARST